MANRIDPVVADRFEDRSNGLLVGLGVLLRVVAESFALSLDEDLFELIEQGVLALDEPKLMTRTFMVSV